MLAVFCTSVTISELRSPIRVEVSTAYTAAVGEYVIANGTIIKGVSLTQNAESDFYVSDITVQIGDYVERGDIIMKTADGHEIAAAYSGVVSSIADISSGAVNGQSVITYTDIDTLAAVVNVAESDASRIRKGQRVILTGNGFKDIQFSGSVKAIGAEAVAVSGSSVCLPVTVSIDNPDMRLKPNFTVKAKISVDEKKTAVIVPQSAIGSDSSGEYVYVVNGGEAVRRSVKTGYSDSALCISNGLNSGENVISDVSGISNKTESVNVSVGAVN